MNNRSAAADHVRCYCLSVNTPSDSRVEADVGAGFPPWPSERSAVVLSLRGISGEATDIQLVMRPVNVCDRGQLFSLIHRFPLIDISVVCFIRPGRRLGDVTPCVCCFSERIL